MGEGATRRERALREKGTRELCYEGEGCRRERGSFARSEKGARKPGSTPKEAEESKGAREKGEGSEGATKEGDGSKRAMEEGKVSEGACG